MITMKIYKKDLYDYPSLFWLAKDLQSLIVSSFYRNLKVTRSPFFHTNFLFIVGSGRSGNTLLRRLMMERLDIFIPPETYVLPKIADYRIRARGLRWQSLVDLVISAFEYHPEFETFNICTLREYAIKAKYWEKENQTINKLIIGLYTWIAEHSGIPSTWVGDKTPLNTLYLGSISKIIPKAKYLYLLRDGADVSVSYINSGIYNNIRDAGKRWARSHKAWNKFKKKQRISDYLELRYEELVANPENIIQEIKAKFNIIERVQDISMLLGDVTSRAHHANVLKPISTDSIGKGRSSLSESQKEELRPVINSSLLNAGYKAL